MKLSSMDAISLQRIRKCLLSMVRLYWKRLWKMMFKLVLREATVAAGVPVIRTIQQQLQLNKIGRVQALLNGTSNFILTEMRKKQLPFAKVLKTAQSLGFAEADPTNDVEGIDAFYKIMILSQLIYGEQPEWNTVELKGIASVSEDKIYHSDGRYKHIAELEKVGDRIQATVRPIIVDEQHPLYSVEGVDNAVVLETSLAGAIMIQGPGAGELVVNLQQVLC